MRIRSMLALPVTFTLAFAGCDACDENLGEIPYPSAELRYADQVTPPLEYLEVGLGAQLVGERSEVTLTLANVGGVPLEVDLLGFTGHPTLCPNPSGAFSVGVAFPFTVEASSEIELPVTFTPQNGSPACALLEVHSNDERNEVLSALFTGQGDAPQLCAEPITVDFGDVYIGSTAEDMVTLRSCGTKPITLTAMEANDQFPPFGYEAPSLPVTLAPDETVDVPVSFSPTVEETYTVATGKAGIVAVTTDDAAEYQITLQGRGARPPSCELSVIPSAVQFGTVATGRDSTQSVVVRNLGDLDCSLDSVVLRDSTPATFTLTAPAEYTAGMTMAPLDALTFEVTFAPSAAAGIENGFLDVSSDDPVNPLIEVPLEGNSVEPQPCQLEAAPTAVNFGNQAVGRTDAVEVELTNVGTETCSVRGIELVSGAPNFSVVESTFPLIGTPLQAGSTMTFQAAYRPEMAGAHSGTVRVEYKEFGFGNADQTLDVPLLGNGVAPRLCVNPTSVDFGTVSVGDTATQSVDVINCGSVAIMVRGVQLRGGSHPGFGKDSVPLLPLELDSGAQFTMNVTATPTDGSAMYGTLEVLSDDTVTPIWPVPLTANGGVCAAGLVCTPDPVNFGPVDVGTQMIRAITCNNPGNAPVTLSPTITGPFELVNFPPSIAPQTAGGLTVRYMPAATGAESGVLDTGGTDCDGGALILDVLGEGVDNFLPVCPTPEAFTPETVWRWEGGGTLPNSKQVWMTPLVSRLEDTDGNGFLTRDDIPRVVVVSFDHDDSPGIFDAADPNSSNSDEINDPTPGVLRALNGKTGAEVWTVTEERYRLNSSVTPALADIDADGFPEIIGQKWIVLEGVADIPEGPKLKGKFVRGALIAFEHDGTFKWESEEWVRSEDEIEDAGAIAVGDMDGDGFAEVVVGDHVFDHTGNLLWRGGKGTGSTGHGPTSVLADVDGIAGLELVAGRTVYRANGAILWDRSDLDGSFLGEDFVVDYHGAVGDVNGDGFNEVVLRGGDLMVLDGASGATLAGPMKPPTRMDMGYECSAPNDPEADDPCNIIPTNPALIDVDGNPGLEIVVSAQETIIVYDGDLNELWRGSIYDGTGASGPIGFDFEADGMTNVMYSDESSTQVWGPTGDVIYDASRGSVTMFETAAVADINLDGHANVVVGSNEPQLGTSDGVDMLSNLGTSWAHARSIWNQHAYVEQLIGELGTPLFDPDSAPLSNFRGASAACELP